MSQRFFRHLSPINLLAVIFIVSVVIRFTGFNHWMPFFGDQAWYFLAARDALTTGKLPLLGITTSITWLHQGPLWTYLLFPVLGLFRFYPAAAAVFITLLSLAEIPLAYYLGSKIKNHQAGLIYAVLLSSFYFSVVHSRLAYHTSPIPLFFVIFLLLLLTGRNFLSGLFLGFLFQSHLLTFIYWPAAVIFSGRSPKFNFSAFCTGFILGIAPLILSGPISTLGIFAWLASRLFLGVSSIGLVSEAYLVVLLAPIALLVSYFFPILPRKLFVFFLTTFIIFNYTFLLTTGYLAATGKYGLLLPTKLQIADQIMKNSTTFYPQIMIVGPGQEFTSTSLPYSYLIWQQSLTGRTLTGSHTRFVVNEQTGQVRVLE